MSGFLPYIKQIVPLNFQQSFSPVVGKAQSCAVSFHPQVGGIGSRSAQNGGPPYSHTSVRNQSNSAPVKIYVSVWISSKVRKLLRNAQF